MWIYYSFSSILNCTELSFIGELKQYAPQGGKMGLCFGKFHLVTAI